VYRFSGSAVFIACLWVFVSACGGGGEERGTRDDGSLDGAQDGSHDAETNAGADAGTADARTHDAGTPRAYRAEDGVMKTRDGHFIFLRGVNYTGQAKWAPGHLAEMTPADIERLVAYGTNSARLLTFWNAVAPEPGSAFDTAYIQAFADRAKMLDEAGFFMVIDMHQDLWGEPFATHGAPAWTCPDEIKQGYTQTSPWWANYLSDQVTGCFDNFYSDTTLQDALAAAWAEVARAVCPIERVIGFDILNEPWPGSRLTDETFDNKVLMPFYKRVIEAVETACPGRLFFAEPSAAFTFGFAKELRVPREYEDRMVIAPHFYPSEVHEPETEGYKGPIEDLERRLLDSIGGYIEDGVPLWIGEFGGVTANPNFDSYMRDLHALLSKHWVPNAIWDYCRVGNFCFLDDAGNLKTVFEDVYTVPVPTLLPSKATLAADWEAGTITSTFDCVAGRGMTVLLNRPTSTCAADPAGILGPFTPGPGFSRADCLAPSAVTVTCAR